jgi:hypothetical protein
MSIELLETAAQALGPLVEEVVFLGGASIQMWISDPAAPATRATNDVDVISAVTSRVGYYQLAERLRERGFSEASDSTVICRWNHRATSLILDVMPQEETVLGFSNPWYRYAIETSIERELPSGTRIRAASPPAIIATKLAAWKGRGKGDMLRSLDLHDILVLLDGRPRAASRDRSRARPDTRIHRGRARSDHGGRVLQVPGRKRDAALRHANRWASRSPRRADGKCNRHELIEPP